MVTLHSMWVSVTFGFLWTLLVVRPSNRTPHKLANVDSWKDVPFEVKFATFCIPCPTDPKTAKMWPILVETENFSLDFAFNIAVSRVNTPYYSSEPNKSVIVYRQSGDEKLKNMYLNFEQRVYHVISHMRNDDSALCLCANEVWGRISWKPLR